MASVSRCPDEDGAESSPAVHGPVVEGPFGESTWSVHFLPVVVRAPAGRINIHDGTGVPEILMDIREFKIISKI